MNGDPLRHTVQVTSPQGLHVRPLTSFAQLARQFQSRVTVSKDGRSVDGKSAFEMFTMVAPKGAELLIEVEGPDAQPALEALVALLERVAEEEAAEPGGA